MSTLSKSWATATTLAKTVDYAGSVAVVAADKAYDYTDDVDLETNGYNGIHATIQYRGSGPVDDLVVAVFASLDGTTFDTEPFMTKRLKNDATPRQASMIVKDVAHLRFGLKTTGQNDTFAYQIIYQAWNIQDI